MALGHLAWPLVRRALRGLVHQHRRDPHSARLLLAHLRRRRVHLAQVLHFHNATKQQAVLAQICMRLVRSSPHKLCHPFGQWSEHPDDPRRQCLVSSMRAGLPGLCHRCLSKTQIGLLPRTEEGLHGLCHLCLANSSLCCRPARSCLLLEQARRGNFNLHQQLLGQRAFQEVRALSPPACQDNHLRFVMRGSVALHGRGRCLHSHRRSRCPIA